MFKKLNTVVLAAACLSLVVACSDKTGSSAKKAVTTTEQKAQGVEQTADFTIPDENSEYIPANNAKIVIADVADSSEAVTLTGNFKKVGEEVTLKGQNSKKTISYTAQAKCVESHSMTCDMVVASVAALVAANPEEERPSVVAMYFQRNTSGSEVEVVSRALPLTYHYSPGELGPKSDASLTDALSQIETLRAGDGARNSGALAAPFSEKKSAK